jgi:hypothetical protein
MKIIKKDNYARESHSDFLVCSGVNEYYGRLFMKALELQRFDSDYYELVSDDYELYKFEP